MLEGVGYFTRLRTIFLIIAYILVKKKSLYLHASNRTPYGEVLVKSKVFVSLNGLSVSPEYEVVLK